MRNLILSALLLSLLFWNCTKETDTDYSTLIRGTWVNTLVDNHAVLTDAAFVMELRSDNVEMYAIGNTVDANNKTWLENDKYIYSLSGNIITINGIGSLGGNFHMELKILSADDQTLVFSVPKFTIDNVEYPDPKIYTTKKVKTDLHTQFVGTWYGKSTTPDNSDDSYHYWEYLQDGHFNYYYKDETGKWISKRDNEGHYFLYGDLLASNYTNDLLTGGVGKAFECWNISIIGNTMFWTGIRENGRITSFRMDRVAGPPISQ